MSTSWSWKDFVYAINWLKESLERVGHRVQSEPRLTSGRSTPDRSVLLKEMIYCWCQSCHHHLNCKASTTFLTSEALWVSEPLASNNVYPCYDFHKCSWFSEAKSYISIQLLGGCKCSSLAFKFQKWIHILETYSICILYLSFA